jgi:uncharacterized protein involved in exopolysaccharide biosynthesis
MVTKTATVSGVKVLDETKAGRNRAKKSKVWVVLATMVWGIMLVLVYMIFCVSGRLYRGK